MHWKKLADGGYMDGKCGTASTFLYQPPAHVRDAHLVGMRVWRCNLLQSINKMTNENFSLAYRINSLAEINY